MRIAALIFFTLLTGIVMASEPAKAIVLQTKSKDHIGFTLFHPDFGANSGDCVFVVVPKKSEIYDTNEVSILLNIKEAGEHQWARINNDVIVSFNGTETLKYQSNGILLHLPSNTELGAWLIAPTKQ